MNEVQVFKDLVSVHFESVGVQEEIFIDTNTTKRIGKRFRMSFCISLKHIEQPLLLCKPDPHHLGSSFTAPK